MSLINQKSSRDESGSVSLLVIIIVVIAVSLSYGIVAVAETLIQKKEAVYGAQSSASAGAYVYGQTFVKEVKRCVKEKIEEYLAESPITDTDQTCNKDKLYVCLESDFKHCEVDLAVCVPEKDEYILTCSDDELVIATSMEAANSSAQTIAQKYQLTDLKLSRSEDTMNVSASKELITKIPVLGMTGNMSIESKSTYKLIQKK